MFLQPYVKDKKGFKLQCYTWGSGSYDQPCIISGYLDDFHNVYLSDFHKYKKKV